MAKLLLFMCIFFSLSVTAQRLQKQVINSLGNSYSNNGIRLSVSVGESVIGKVGSANAATLSQGFFTGQKSAQVIDPGSLATNDYSIFPNPVRTTLNLKGNLSIVSQFKIYDLAGNFVLQQKIVNGTIQMNNIASGFYFAKLLGISGEVLHTFKIVKY